MGIRKHFEQQKEEDPDFKISDFSFDVDNVESKEFQFDAESEISPELIEKIQQTISNLITKHTEGSWLAPYYAESLKILFADKVNQAELDEFYPVLKQQLEQTKEKARISREAKNTYLFQASAMKLLFPEKADELGLNAIDMRQMLKEHIIMDFNINRTDPSEWRTFVANVYYFKILYPELADQELEIEEHDWQDVKDRLIELSRNKEIYERISFVKLLAKLKVIMPEIANQILADKKIQKTIREAFDQTRIDTLRGIGLVSSMKILASEKVTVTDQGLELIPRRSSFKQQKQKRPERRNF